MDVHSAFVSAPPIHPWHVAPATYRFDMAVPTALRPSQPPTPPRLPSPQSPPASPEEPSKRLGSGLPKSPRRPRGAPARLYAFVALALAGLLALGAAIAVGVNNARSGLGDVADRSAPRAATAADLYFALADLDAQVANVLLVGSNEEIGNRQLA